MLCVVLTVLVHSKMTDAYFCNRYGEAGLKGGLGGMGGQGGEAYGSPFDIFEQFFGGQGGNAQFYMHANIIKSALHASGLFSTLACYNL